LADATWLRTTVVLVSTMIRSPLCLCVCAHLNLNIVEISVEISSTPQILP